MSNGEDSQESGKNSENLSVIDSMELFESPDERSNSMSGLDGLNVGGIGAINGYFDELELDPIVDYRGASEGTVYEELILDAFPDIGVFAEELEEVFDTLEILESTELDGGEVPQIGVSGDLQVESSLPVNRQPAVSVDKSLEVYCSRVLEMVERIGNASAVTRSKMDVLYRKVIQF